MAGHYMDCAANTDLPASKKLVMMCIADDADKQSRIGRVGLDAIRKWSGLGRSRALEVIKELVDDGYLARHAAGRIGRQAEFVVFPSGCCPLHGPVPGHVAPAPAVDKQPRPSKRGSGGPDPLPAVDAAEGPEEGPEEGPVQGPAQTGPPLELLELPEQEPPNPPARRGAKCAHGRSTGCRPCGTSPRAARQAQVAAAAEHERQRAAVRWCGAYHCDRSTRRIFDPDTGMPSKCPDCHPDLVIGPALPAHPPVALHIAPPAPSGLEIPDDRPAAGSA